MNVKRYKVGDVLDVLGDIVLVVDVTIVSNCEVVVYGVLVMGAADWKQGEVHRVELDNYKRIRPIC